jgi:hypothetical protein
MVCNFLRKSSGSQRTTAAYVSSRGQRVAAILGGAPLFLSGSSLVLRLLCWRETARCHPWDADTCGDQHEVPEESRKRAGR